MYEKTIHFTCTHYQGKTKALPALSSYLPKVQKPYIFQGSGKIHHAQKKPDNIIQHYQKFSMLKPYFHQMVRVLIVRIVSAILCQFSTLSRLVFVGIYSGFCMVRGSSGLFTIARYWTLTYYNCTFPLKVES